MIHGFLILHINAPKLPTWNAVLNVHVFPLQSTVDRLIEFGR